MTATMPANLGSVLRGRARILKGASIWIPLGIITACSGAPQVDPNPVGQSSGGGNAGGAGGVTSAASTTVARTAGNARGGGSGLKIDLGRGGSTEEGKSAGGSSAIANPGDNRKIEEKCAETSDVATDIVTVQPADIVFAIDGSSSMAEETQFVREQMNEFSRKIMDSGIDVRVIVIAAETGGAGGAGGAANTTAATAAAGRPAFPGGPGYQRQTFGICIDAPLGSGECPKDENLPHYARVPVLVDSNDSLNLFISTYPEYKDHLRPEASKSLVVVSDDNATARPNNSAEIFKENFTALDPTLLKDWTFNGVFCFTQCEQAFAIGSVYADLVSQTDGVSGDLCLQDFEPVFNRLAEQIIQKSGSEIECEWVLPERDKGQTFSPALVEAKRVDSNGTTKLGRVASMEQCGDKGGWYFDSNLNPTKILACESSCQSMQNTDGGGIEISFGCESVASCVASDSSALNTDSCSWPLPKPPSGQDLVISSVNVRYTSASGFATDLGRVEGSSECENVEEGWYYDDAERPTKVLACPQTCKQIQAGGENSKLEVLFGCETAKAPPINLF